MLQLNNLAILMLLTLKYLNVVLLILDVLFGLLLMLQPLKILPYPCIIKNSDKEERPMAQLLELLLGS